MRVVLLALAVCVWFVDRIEGDWAVLMHQQTDETVEVRLSDLPAGIKEGDCLEKLPR